MLPITKYFCSLKKGEYYTNLKKSDKKHKNGWVGGGNGQRFRIIVIAIFIIPIPFHKFHLILLLYFKVLKLLALQAIRTMKRWGGGFDNSGGGHTFSVALITCQNALKAF